MSADKDWARLVRTTLLPTLGMAFFWTFFRYQNFFMVLFPRSREVPLMGSGLNAHAVFLVVFALLSVGGLVAWRTVARWLRERRWLVVVVGALGSVGASVALAVSFSGLAESWLWPSFVLVAAGLLVSILAWADCLSQNFGPRQLVVVAASYLLSLLVFRNPQSSADVVKIVLTALVPFGSAALWFACPPRTADGADLREAPSNMRELLNLTVWLFIAFLLAGSVVRGIVDTVSLHVVGQMSPRFRMSVPITTVFVLITLAYALIARARQARRAPGSSPAPAPTSAGTAPAPAPTPAPTSASTARFCLWCWVGFSALFFVGLTIFLASGGGEAGGNLVVISRSMLEVSFWMLLCDLSSRRSVEPVPLFIVCSALVEAASWASSYVAVPMFMDNAAGGGADLTSTLLALTAFGLSAALAVVCGVMVVLLGRHRATIPPNDWLPTRTGFSDAGASPAAAGAPDAADPTRKLSINEVEARMGEALAAALTSRYGLTAREAAVALLFARGYSLAKVSGELGITQAAAQSNIRSTYRKLGVHSKDELIEVVGSLR